jgi:hypothetical protein
MKTNICKRCGKEFTSTKTAKACSSACRNWLFVQTRKEIYNTQSKQSYARRKKDPNNIKRYLWSYAKARAIKKNVPFTITKEDILLPDVCPVLNVPMNKESNKYCYSIDRIIPELGYIPENIQVISKLANCMKWDSTREERLAFANWVLSSEGG